MSRAGLARIWQVLGAILAVYATGTWIILQGGKSFAEIPGLEAKSPVTSAYIAVPIIGALLGILASVGLLFMRTARSRGKEVFPIVAIADVGPHTMKSFSMAAYQGFFVLLFLLVPSASLYQLNTIVLQRGVLWHDGDPALGSIALKNAYGLTTEGSPQDGAEHSCASTVMRAEGFTWLANMRCDLVKNAQVGPFSKAKAALVSDAEAAPEKTCTRELALQQSGQQRCEGSRDLSEECEGYERHCRGVQWLPVISPLLLAVPTSFGLLMTAWLLIEAACRKFLP